MYIFHPINKQQKNLLYSHFLKKIHSMFMFIPEWAKICFGKIKKTQKHD